MKRSSLWPIIAAAGLLSALPAFAAPVRGRVTAVDATAKTITLATGRQQAAQTPTTLHVNDSTKYTVGVQGALSDIKVGDTVRVMGQTNGNAVTARMIAVVPSAQAAPAAPAGGRQRMGVQGVVATTTPALTITTADNQTDTITTDPSTIVSTTKPGTFDDVKVGTYVTAQTTGEGDSAVATSVDVSAMGQGQRGQGQRGQGRRGGRRGGANQQGAPAPAPAPDAPAAPAAPAVN